MIVHPETFLRFNRIPYQTRFWRDVTMGPELFPGDLLFRLGPIFIGLVFIIVIGGILLNIFKGIGQWQKNNASPQLTVPARAVSKRTHVSRRANANHDNLHGSSRTSYFITFEFESGDRTELQMDGGEYGQIVEGDSGTLTFQGTRYLGFERLGHHEAR